MAGIDSSALPRINVLESFTETPEPLDFVLPGMIAGTVGALIAPGGAGKSWFALEIAIALAGGPDFLGVGIRQTGDVLYLSAEDPALALSHRLHTVSYAVRDVAADISAHLEIVSLMGRVVDLNQKAWSDAIKKMAKGRRLVILDTLRRFHCADENNGGEMAALLGILESIAGDTGASILFLHHAGKGSVLNGGGDIQQASRGSSVLTDNVRGGQINLAGMTETEAKNYGVADRGSYVRVVQSKVNFGGRSLDRWLQRAEGGLLVPVSLDAAQRDQQPQSGRSRRERGNA
ncbi:helicase RepA family protein [Acetobacter orientalis]|uniref:helicase RepA family protein n=1 Tax=Acetobacter orientalis TaxID=146474 RepID=UPI00209E7C96|nr:helicase RepA family protein [Acetobacter orientalis]MCP1217309.1 helicase RepA family protein [Acetobacter orientalis]MCP1220198.1 helicase RepA family protein [Acetobacter orientalis]